MKTAERWQRLDTGASHVVTTVQILMVAYLIAFPIVCRLDNTRIPLGFRPCAHILETKASRPFECYLCLWGVDPTLVRCAMYEP
jgi:hypothetical protein